MVNFRGPVIVAVAYSDLSISDLSCLHSFLGRKKEIYEVSGTLEYKDELCKSQLDVGCTLSVILSSSMNS